jgi:transcriptional regulator with XRE-family HTH domain
MKAYTELEVLGRALRTLREVVSLSQAEVADRAGITRPMLSSYERGKVQPTLDILWRLLAATDADLGILQQQMVLVRMSDRCLPRETKAAMLELQMVRIFREWLHTVRPEAERKTGAGSLRAAM